MEPLRLDPVPARVVAWHNRHPLACRITPEHVGSMGYVALPFAQTPGKGRLRRGFDEDFLDGASLRLIARWAARHGVPAPEAPTDGPLRVVAPEKSLFAPEDQVVTLYVRTAFIDDGWQHGRVLVGAGERPSVWGRRLYSKPRLVATAGVLGSAALAVLLFGPRSAPPAEQTLVAVGSLPASASASAASGVAVAVSGRGEGAASAAPAASAASAPLAVAAGDRPVDVNPRWGTIDLPVLRPTLGPTRTAAALAAASAPEAAAHAAPHAEAPSPRPAPARAMAPPVPPPPAAPMPPQPVWALSTRGYRNEAETEQVTVAMAALFQRAGLRAVRVQALEVDRAWHVVAMPFPTRDAAENARNLLATRGLRTEPVEF